MRYLHITEASGWTKYIVDIFERAAPGQNLYLVKTEDRDDPRQSDSADVVHCRGGSPEYRAIIKRIAGFDLVVVHNLLNDYKVELILNAPKATRIHWISWGDDIYCARGLRNSIFEERTQALLESKRTKRQRLAHRWLENTQLGAFAYDQARFGWMRSRYDRIRQAARRVQSISTIVPAESSLIARYFNPDVPCFTFFYGSLKHFIRGLPDEPTSGDAVFVGNSAYPSNNHLEAFDFIERTPQLAGCEIITPLAYGDKFYGDVIEADGRRRFGARFAPLREIVEYEAYVRMYARRGYVVMNHRRQQALGKC